MAGDSVWRLRSALVEFGRGDDPERVALPPNLARVIEDVRAALGAPSPASIP